VLGRCVGNSAFPVFNNQGDYTPITTDVPLESAPSFPNDYVETGVEDEIYAHGYAILELGSDQATATYYQVLGEGDGFSQQLWQETIPACV